jgi:hypothetical protein
LDCLIFNDSFGAYISRIIFAIFCWIAVFIAGVVLLTHIKPDKLGAPPRRKNAEREGTKARVL